MYGAVFITGVRLFSTQAVVHARADTVYAPGRRATGPGRLGAVLGPSPGGALVANGMRCREYHRLRGGRALRSRRRHRDRLTRRPHRKSVRVMRVRRPPHRACG
ncbi:hypothetical protein GCM10010446_56310 [Streptomyces enissocaesilis]|uniref:Uncharacterized protein n=1 Tax=Streptomyces enissocaesilis TaxID=332589 RepID=A0ABP6K5F5_9ACTN